MKTHVRAAHRHFGTPSRRSRALVERRPLELGAEKEFFALVDVARCRSTKIYGGGGDDTIDAGSGNNTIQDAP